MTKGLAVHLTGLEKSVSYNFSVCAYTSRGRGPYSESIWATTSNSGKLLPNYNYV